MHITEATSIEELIETVPASIPYLSEKGIQCVVCGEAVWGTLKEVVLSKGFTKEQLSVFVRELRELAQ